MMRSFANAKSKTLLFVAFGLLLTMITVLIALGLERMESFNAQVRALTEAQGRKIGVVSELFLANGQRSALIDKLFAASTRPVKESVLASYQGAVSAYGGAVKQLRKLDVTGTEREARDAAIASAAKALAMGDRIVALLMQSQVAPASELNLTQAVLIDSRLQETLYRLLEANHAQTAQSISVANEGMRHGFLLLGAGGILALIAGVVIAVLVIRVVTRTEARLEREKELAEVTLHSIVDGVITTGEDGRIDYLNSVAERFLGWTSAEAKGRLLSEVYRVVDERTGTTLEALPLTSAQGSEEPEPIAVRLVDRHGRECPVRYSHAPIRGRDGTVHGMIVVFHDVSQLRAMAQQLTWQANHDSLTGLVNRREFERRLGERADRDREDAAARARADVPGHGQLQGGERHLRPQRR